MTEPDFYVNLDTGVVTKDTPYNGTPDERFVQFRHPDDEDAVEVVVCDTGEGIGLTRVQMDTLVSLWIAWQSQLPTD